MSNLANFAVGQSVIVIENGWKGRVIDVRPEVRLDGTDSDAPDPHVYNVELEEEERGFIFIIFYHLI